MKMSSRRAAVAALACVVASAVMSTAPVAATDEPPDLTVTPTSGPAGTVVTVSGDDCAFNSISIFLVKLPSAVVAQSGTESSDNGTWSGTVTVPQGADPAADYVVTAQCFVSAGEQSQVKHDYEQVPFDVTGGGTTPTTPTTTPPGEPTEPPVIDPEAVPVAPVAVAVVADPDFTG
jgi:hypothetical protein